MLKWNHGSKIALLREVFELTRNRLAQRLVQLRQEKGLTQGMLAKHLDVSHASVVSWECGRTDPSLFMVECIAFFYGCSLDYLCGITDVRGVGGAA